MPRFDDDNGLPYLPLAVTASGPSGSSIAVACPDLPAEVSVARAAEILGCDKKQVGKFIKHGHLSVRNKSGPWSSRPQFAIQLESVLKLRCSYRTYNRPEPRQQAGQRRKTIKSSSESSFIKLD